MNLRHFLRIPVTFSLLDPRKCTQSNGTARHLRTYSDVQYSIKGLVYKRFAEGSMQLTNTHSFLAMYPIEKCYLTFITMKLYLNGISVITNRVKPLCACVFV